MPVAEITARLDRLKDDQFIAYWGREGRRWWIQCGSTFGPYTQSQIGAWIEGTEAMGAASA